MKLKNFFKPSTQSSRNNKKNKSRSGQRAQLARLRYRTFVAPAPPSSHSSSPSPSSFALAAASSALNPEHSATRSSETTDKAQVVTQTPAPQTEWQDYVEIIDHGHIIGVRYVNVNCTQAPLATSTSVAQPQATMGNTEKKAEMQQQAKVEQPKPMYRHRFNQNTKRGSAMGALVRVW